PFECNPLSPMMLHRFLYGNLNPVQNTDPSGQFTLIEAIATVALEGILATAFVSVSWVPKPLLQRAVDPAGWIEKVAKDQIIPHQGDCNEFLKAVASDPRIDITLPNLNADGLIGYFSGLGRADGWQEIGSPAEDVLDGLLNAMYFASEGYFVVAGVL